MKYWIFSLLILIGSGFAQESGCISCHLELDEDLDDDKKIVDGYLRGVHATNNIGCADCHGGDPKAYNDEDEAMWDMENFISDLQKSDQLDMCGKCHSDPTYMRMYLASPKTDQVAQYLTSNHGIELLNGNEKAASCSNCHTVHGIRPVSDPLSSVYPLNISKTCSKCHADPYYMAETNLPVDQFNQYRNSVHGIALFDNEDLGAPACNDCHGNHGASPPNVVHVKDICGTCHVNNRDLFQDSHLNEKLLEKGFGQCEACHDNHGVIKPDDSFLDWSNNSMCIECHPSNGEPKLMADHFFSVIKNLKSDIHFATNLVNDAENKGMIVDDLLFDLEEAHKVLIHTRTNIHSFNMAYVDSHAYFGFEAAHAAIDGANESLDEFNYRRRGLFYFSLIITFTVVVLGLKIKLMK